MGFENFYHFCSDPTQRRIPHITRPDSKQIEKRRLNVIYGNGLFTKDVEYCKETCYNEIYKMRVGIYTHP